MLSAKRQDTEPRLDKQEDFDLHGTSVEAAGRLNTSVGKAQKI